MEFPLTTAIIGALLIILQQVFMVMAGTHRAKVSIGVGFADDKDLERKIRRHGNLAENAAIFLVVLGFAEALSGGGVVTTILGFAFLVARIAHGIAFSSLSGSHLPDQGSHFFVLCRLVGALGSGFSGIALGLYLLWLLAL